MGGIFQLFWGRGGDFKELGHHPLLGLLMVDLGTVMAPLGMSFSLLMEDQSLVIEVDLSAILGSFDSNHWFMLCPQAMSFFQGLCPAPFPP